MPLTFNSTLSSADWDVRAGGWRCEALKLPGSTLAAVFADGEEADPRKYRVSDSLITWSGAERPDELLVKIELTKDLPDLEREKLKVERDKVAVERSKYRLEKRWKWISASGVVLAALVTFTGTWFLKPGGVGEPKANAGAPQVVPPVSPKMVSQLPESSADEYFDIIKDISVFDLRAWKPTPPEQQQKRYSPVNYINYLHVRKKKQTAKFVAHYATGGYAIDLRCITQEADILQKASASHADEKAYSVEVNVEREPVGSEFLVVIEGTYWNGFANPKEETASTYTDRDISMLGELALVVLFPEDKPFKGFDLLTKREGADHYSHYLDNSRQYADEQKRFIYWSIRGREPNAHYRIRWDW